MGRVQNAQNKLVKSFKRSVDERIRAAKAQELSNKINARVGAGVREKKAQ